MLYTIRPKQEAGNVHLFNLHGMLIKENITL